MQAMSVAALGRRAKLGDLYDGRAETFVGVNLFGGEELSLDPFVQKETDESVKIKLSWSPDGADFSANLFRDCCDHFGMSLDLQLSVLTGLVALDGAAKCLVHTHDRSAAALLLAGIMTTRERLNLFDADVKQLMRPDVLRLASGSAAEATHVVSEVEYGANAVIVFECYSKAAAAAVDKSLTAWQIPVKVQHSNKDTDTATAACRHNAARDTNCDRVHVYSDVKSVDADKAPCTLELALAHIKTLLSQAKCPGVGQLVPLTYALFPLAFIKMYLEIPEASDSDSRYATLKHVGESTARAILQLFASVAMRRHDLKRLEQQVSRFSLVATEEDAELVQKLSGELKTYEQGLRDDLRGGLLVHSKAQNNSSGMRLEDIVTNFERDPRSPNSTAAQVESLAAGLRHSISFMEAMQGEGARFVSAQGPELASVTANGERDAYVYVLHTYGQHRATVTGPDAPCRSWNLNQRLFIALCRDAKRRKQGACTDLFFVQTASSPGLNGKPAAPAVICKYRNGKIVTPDVLNSDNVCKGPTAKPVGSKTMWRRGGDCDMLAERTLVRVPCPRAGKDDSPCAKDPLTWRCSKCRSPLEFGFDADALFYCACGRTPPNEFTFHCGDWLQHGFEWTGFDSTVLKAQLAALRPSRQINILLFGQSGVGKSTLVNGFANYLTFATLKEAVAGEDVNQIPVQVSLEDEAGKLVQIQSGPAAVTKQDLPDLCTSYLFYRGDTIVRLVDTPGMGALRGPTQDAANLSRILTHISRLKELHAICVLMRSNESRMSAVWRFSLLQLLSLLHKDAARSIVFCFTFARGTYYRPGDTLPTLRAFLHDHSQHWAGLYDALRPGALFCFDNEAVRALAAVRHGIRLRAEDERGMEQSWRNAAAETSRLLQHVEGLRPHPTIMTMMHICEVALDEAQAPKENIPVYKIVQARLCQDCHEKAPPKRSDLARVLATKLTDGGSAFGQRCWSCGRSVEKFMPNLDASRTEAGTVAQTSKATHRGGVRTARAHRPILLIWKPVQAFFQMLGLLPSRVPTSRRSEDTRLSEDERGGGGSTGCFGARNRNRNGAEYSLGHNEKIADDFSEVREPSFREQTFAPNRDWRYCEPQL